MPESTRKWRIQKVLEDAEGNLTLVEIATGRGRKKEVVSLLPREAVLRAQLKDAPPLAKLIGGVLGEAFLTKDLQDQGSRGKRKQTRRKAVTLVGCLNELATTQEASKRADEFARTGTLKEPGDDV